MQQRASKAAKKATDKIGQGHVASCCIMLNHATCMLHLESRIGMCNSRQDPDRDKAKRGRAVQRALASAAENNTEAVS